MPGRTVTASAGGALQLPVMTASSPSATPLWVACLCAGWCRTCDGYRPVHLDEVLWVSADDNYIHLHTAAGAFMERATLAETTYAVLRRKLGFERLALTGSGPRARRLAILGFSGDRAFLKSALSAQEKDWLDACLTVSPTELQPASATVQARQTKPCFMNCILRSRASWPADRRCPAGCRPGSTHCHPP